MAELSYIMEYCTRTSCAALRWSLHAVTISRACAAAVGRRRHAMPSHSLPDSMWRSLHVLQPL